MRCNSIVLLLALVLAGCTGKGFFIPYYVAGSVTQPFRTEDTPSPLHLAAKAGDLAQLRSLLAQGARIDSVTPVSRMTALHFAVAAGQTGAVTWLVDNGSNVNAQDAHFLTPLGHACAYGHAETALFLLRSGASVARENSIHNDRLLIMLLGRRFGHSLSPAEIALASELISRGVDVNSRSTDGYTALHLAAREGHGQVVRLLLKNGADANVKNRNGETPLTLAQARAHQQIVDMLLAYSASDKRHDSKQ